MCPVYSNKSLGQHFILDSNIHKKIVRVAGPIEGYNVIEIGPGYGGLTKAILEAGPRSFLAIEKDLSFASEHAKIFPDGLFFYGDALDVDERSFFTDNVKIIANLPYNIAAPLLFKWLAYMSFFTSITVMVQEEFAARLAAGPGSKTYGRISILTQLFCDVRYEFSVNPKSFVPPPKVDSAVITLKSLSGPRFAHDYDSLRDFTRFAFNHRRKQLGGTLKAYLGGNKALADKILFDLNISPQARPEVLALDQHCALSLAISALPKC